MKGKQTYSLYTIDPWIGNGDVEFCILGAEYFFVYHLNVVQLIAPKNVLYSIYYA